MSEILGRSCVDGLGPSYLHGGPGSSLPGTMSMGLSAALSFEAQYFSLWNHPPQEEKKPFLRLMSENY